MVRRQNRLARSGRATCCQCEWWDANIDRDGGRWECGLHTGGQVHSQGWCTNPEVCGKHERIAKHNTCPACKHLKEIPQRIFSVDLSQGEDIAVKTVLERVNNGTNIISHEIL